jgi:glycine dehydrogenase subunit 1
MAKPPASWCSIPTFLGRVPDLAAIAEAAHAKGALLIAVVTEPVALGLIEAPGHLGADIVVGEGQSLGVGLQFGGPYLGLFGCREKFVRQMPGRLCGETVDAEGKRGFVLTLSTREQHIRREKATSNICTNSGLCALAFSIHMTLLGGAGLASWRRSTMPGRRPRRSGWRQGSGGDGAQRCLCSTNSPWFCPKTRAKRCGQWPTGACWAGCRSGGSIPVRQNWRGLLVCTTELTTDEDIEALARRWKEVLA